MTDLIDRLNAALDEDERIAREAVLPVAGHTGRWALTKRNELIEVRDGMPGEVARHVWPAKGDHIARHDPARVLRQVEGARKILESHVRPHECQHLTARGDHSVVDGKPWVFFEPAHTDETGGHCDVVLALAEMFGVEP